MFNRLKFLLQRTETKVLVVLFIAVTLWRVFLIFDASSADAKLDHLKVWGASYQIVALVGAISGLLISKKWGGYKSIIGRSVIAFSLGLLFQVFGQSVYSFYNVVLHQDVLYPSIGDIGFFGSIPLYIYGVLLLARVSGAFFSLRFFSSKIQAFIIPIIILVISYSFFLKGYVFDWSQPIKVFLDFGYPLGQALYVSLAISTYLLSRNMLGGLMRRPVLLLLVALVAQYICDYMFLYISSRGTWVVASIYDYSYMISYFLMAIALVNMGVMFKKIAETNHNE